MLTLDRQNKIKQQLLEEKSVNVLELAEKFKVSSETIRRDLKALEQEGVAERAYGGAILKNAVHSRADFKDLSTVLLQSKQLMAERAVGFIRQGDCIFLDFSTSCLQLAKIIPDQPLTVVTNSLEVANEMTERNQVQLIITGGNWDEKNRAFMGTTTVQNLSQYHMDRAFISARAVHITEGVSDRTEQESEIRSQVIGSSNKVYLIEDHTKIDKINFIKTCGFENVAGIITDDVMSDKWHAMLQERGIKCIDGTEPKEED